MKVVLVRLLSLPLLEEGAETTCIENHVFGKRKTDGQRDSHLSCFVKVGNWTSLYCHTAVPILGGCEGLRAQIVKGGI